MPETLPITDAAGNVVGWIMYVSRDSINITVEATDTVQVIVTEAEA